MKWLGFLVVACVLAVSIAPAAADDRKAAERHYRAGEMAYKAQNFSAAAENFEAAYKELPLPEIAFSAAQAYRRQFRVANRPELAKRSVELYRLYLDQVKAGGRVGDAADSLGEMQRELDRVMAAGAKMAPLMAARPAGTRLGISPQLTLESTTMREVADLPGAEEAATKIVTKLDGTVVPAFELVDVTPGQHKLAVEADGYIATELTVQARENESLMKEITLKPRPAQVTIATERGARIRVDGRPIGTTPLAALELTAGRHVIAVSRDGREPIAREVVVTRGQELTLREPLEKTTKRKAVPWVIGAAGVLGAIAITTAVGAVVEDGRAQDTLTRIETEGDQTELDAAAYDRHVEMRDQLVVGAWTFGGAAVLVGAAAAVLYFFDSPSEDSARVVPAMVPGGGAVTLSGRF
jgi:hypothetical protein